VRFFVRLKQWVEWVGDHFDRRTKLTVLQKS
jgi:hypothetical protein